MRTPATLVVTIGLVGLIGFGLTACSSSASDGSSDTASKSAACDPVAAGTLSKGVTVEGEFGQKPTVTFASPETATTTQRTVISAGDGAQVKKGDTAIIDFSLYNASTGAEVASTGYTVDTTAQFVMDDTTYLPGFVHSIQCSTVGSRIAAVVPAADLWGEAGQSSLKMAGTDSAVFVADVISIVPNRALGADQTPQAGFPTVTLDKDGKPTVTIPDSPAPTDLQIEVLKKGSGAVVADGDTVTVQYQGTNWTTKKVFDQSWGKGRTQFATGDVVPGFGQAMIGQTVGSQVLVVIPPALAYGSAGTTGIGGTDDIVFVIDILATAH